MAEQTVIVQGLGLIAAAQEIALIVIIILLGRIAYILGRKP